MKNKKVSKLMCMVVLGIGVTANVAFAQTGGLVDFSMDPMNVTAMGYEKSELDTPADITIYTAKQLKKTGAFDVANALKFMPGVQYTTTGPHDQGWITGNTSINLRGIKGGTLVLINGVSVMSNGVSHLDTISIEDVERVEVVKGGGAVLYGSDAYGGVINVITKKSYTNNLKVAMGNKGQKNYDLSVGEGKWNFAWTRSEMDKTGNMTDKKGTLTVDGVSTPYYVGFGDSKKDTFSVGYKFDDHVKFEYMLRKKDYSISYNNSKAEVQKLFNYDDKEHYARFVYENKGLSADTYFTRRDIENPDYYLVNPTNVEWEHSDHKKYGFNIKKTWDVKDAKVLIGVDTKKETYYDENKKYMSWFQSKNSAGTLKDVAKYGKYNLKEYSVYGQYDRSLSDTTNLVFSMREDIIHSDSGNYNSFLPQIQLLKKLDDESSIYANVGKSFKMPTFRQLYYSSGSIASNPDLEPEKAWNYEVGYKHVTGDNSWKAALFAIDMEDMISSRKNAEGVSESYNAAKYKNKGLELSYSRKVDDNFSYEVGGIYSNPQKQNTVSSKWKDILGKYQLMTSLNYQNAKFESSLNVSYIGGRIKNSTEKDIAPLVISNLNLGYKLKEDVKLTFKVDNIFDRRDLTNPDSDYYTDGRRFEAGVVYNF